MAVSVTPYIPDYITVHMGLPTQAAEDVTVSFADYIKNVASSEIYPTWDEDALRANILAQISYALNRVYTEYYPSRGYPFQITATTALDQKFIKGRDIFEPIAKIVDEIFDSYLRRQGNAEPLAAKFCNGTTTTCDGLSQWGSEKLAQQGYETMEIIRYYYGDNVERVDKAPIRSPEPSYPGYPLTIGSTGADVIAVQVALNRIAQDYPAIPKLWPVDGVFGTKTAASVKKFQQIFNLTPDGIVGKATWYKLVALHVGVKRLSELASEGQRLFAINLQHPQALQIGSQGSKVLALQYALSLLAEVNTAVPFVAQDGIFGAETQNAVKAVQGVADLPQTGIVDKATWEYLLRQVGGIDSLILQRPELFPPESASRHTQYPGYDLTLGTQDRKGVTP